MATFRINKNRNYTVMSNYHLRDRSLSLKAKGILSLMLSLPEDWDYSVQGLVQLSMDQTAAVNSALKELERTGYLRRTRERNELGRLGDMVYDVYEEPVHEEPAEPDEKKPENTPSSPKVDFPILDNPTLEKPIQEKPTLGKPILENQVQISTKELSTKEPSTKRTKQESKKVTAERPAYNEIIDDYSKDPEVRAGLKQFLVGILAARKKKHEVFTNDALRSLLVQLDKLSTSPDEQLRIIDRSLRNGYKDFYPPETKTGTTRGKPADEHKQQAYDFDERGDLVVDGISLAN